MILIVDDDDGMTETCSMLLEAHGFNVSVAATGAEALSRMRGTAPALVIADCAMPGMSGVELSETLKADPATSSVSVLLISGSLRCDVAKGNSYQSFLKKPFLAENLLVEVRKLLQVEGVAAPEYSKV